MKNLTITKSLRYWDKASKLIPCGTMTMSKGPQYYVQGSSPIYLQRGKGSHVWDVDGNEYIDYVLALGPVILGYNYASVNRAVIEQLKEGVIFSLMHPSEIELAEKLCQVIPCAESARFFKTGSETTSAAVRVARSYTNRDMIVSCGYHGWHDWCIGGTSRNLGVPERLRDLTLKFDYNDIDGVRRLFKQYPDKIAAVVMEPVGIEEPKDNFLQEIRKTTRKYGSLLIFDEIITGFRLSIGGAQDYFKVTPDLACFGKAMANGFPISALVGKGRIMKTLEKAFVSSTFGGETVSIKAAISTIDEIKNKDVCSYILKMGSELKKRFNDLSRSLGVDVEMKGLPHKTVCIFKDKKGNPSQLNKSLFLQEALSRGVVIGNGQFISYSHSKKDLEKTLIVCKEALQILKDAVKKNKVSKLLRGKISKEVFRKP